MAIERSYAVVLEPEAEGGFSVHIPAFRGAHTQGETYDEAVSNARDVIALHMEVLAERGEAIPPLRRCDYGRCYAAVTGGLAHSPPNADTAARRSRLARYRPSLTTSAWAPTSYANSFETGFVANRIEVVRGLRFDAVIAVSAPRSPR